MLAGILLHIVKLKTTCSHESDHYGVATNHEWDTRQCKLLLVKSSQQFKTTKCHKEH